MRLVSFKTRGRRWAMGAVLPGDEVFEFAAEGRPCQTHDVFDTSPGSWLASQIDLCRRILEDRSYGVPLRQQGRIIPLQGLRLGPPVARPGKLICLGMNYRDHAQESGLPIPDKPVIFAKFATAVIGPEEAVVLSPDSAQVDFEVELAVVIGRSARLIGAEKAAEHILGYTIVNDVSARDFQFGDGQWVRGKSCDTFAPLGPWIVLPDEVSDPHQLRISLRLNGTTMQDSNTREMVFRIPEVISYLSRSMTLEPGDVIASGTPPGVGFSRKPPVFLASGDVMEADIEGIGVLKNVVVAS